MAMAVVGILVLGWLSLVRLPLEFLPTFSSSSITVTAPYPSSSPREIERLIVRPLEDSLGTINGIETMAAGASANSGRVTLSFIDGTDMDMAAVEVRDRIDRARHLLPDDLQQISVRRFQSSDIPVLRFDLSAEWSQERLYDFAENTLLRRLERLDGVARVRIAGLRSPELQVNLDLSRLQAHGVDVRRLRNLLRSNNVNLTAGDLIVGSHKILVRSVGEFSSAEEIEKLPINGNGLRLQDVAEVAYTFPRKEEFSFLNGKESLSVSINKDSSTNLLEVVDRVKEEIDAILSLPEAEGVAIRIYRDASLDVRKGLGQLRDAGLVGGLLAILAMYLFLRRVRTTALVAVAIPISLVATFVMMYLLRQSGILDITLNVISLAGLMLALGMLVDNSVVVIDSIFRHRSDLRENSRTAALQGASEVALPVIASTATTMCVFLPMIFLSSGGRFKLYMANIGVTICIVMVASLVVSLTVVPAVAVWMLRGEESRQSASKTALSRLYRKTLGFTLRHRFGFVVSIVLAFGGVVYLFTTIERSFLSRSLERQIVVHVDTPRQYSLAQTEVLYDRVYEILDTHRGELDIADIAYGYDRGRGKSRGGWSRERQFNLYLKDEEDSKRSTAEVQDRLRQLLPVVAGVNLRIATSRGRSGSAGIEIELSGDDPAVLEILSREVMIRLQSIPMIRDVDSSLESGDEEIRVAVQSERALQVGISNRGVALTVSNSLSSRAISHFKTGEREVDLIMQFREEDRETLDQLKKVPVYAGATAIPLGALADFEIVAGPSVIERQNHRSKVTISGNATSSRASFGAMRMVTSMMNELQMPPGYEWRFGRWNRFNQRDQESGLFALLFALPLVYMLLAVLFESLVQPFTIMFSVPFALLGVGVVMKLAHQPWDTMTMIGLIVLLGVVVNNAIVLIDHINYLRTTGLDRTAAILLGGEHRSRPIMITAVTTILGLTPMVAPFVLPQWFGAVEGRAASWAPIGLVIIGGLTTSTFLTLMIIPTIYSLLDDLSSFARRVAIRVSSIRSTGFNHAVKRSWR